MSGTLCNKYAAVRMITPFYASTPAVYSLLCMHCLLILHEGGPVRKTCNQLHALRMRVERTLAWGDKYKRLLLRCERAQQ